MNVIQVAKPYFPKEDIEKIMKDMRAIFESGMLMQGKFVKEFEEAFANFVGTKYAVAVSSGTAALHGILNYYDIKDREVIVPVNTFLATSNAVLYEGGIHVFADINPKTLCIDTKEFEKKITPKTKGAIIVHLAGLIPPNIDEIREICKKNKLFLIEDAAHASGSSHDGKKAGALTDAGAFSFLATKPMTTGGEGGIVTTDNEEIAKRIISLRFHGEDKTRGIEDRVGYSWRMTEMQAIVGIAQTKRLSEIIDKRMRVAQLYDKAFHALSRVSIIPVSLGDRNAYYKYPLILDKSLKRDEVKKNLEENFGIKTGTSYWPPCHLQPAYKEKFGYKEGDFPVAEDVLNRTISLPIYCDMTDEEINRVIEGVKKVCG